MNKDEAVKLSRYLGIDVTLEDTRKGELRCLCPFHEDKQSSFGINWEKEMWNCFAGCGGGNLPKLIRRIKKLDIISVNKVLKEYGIIHSVLSILPSYDKLKNKKEELEDLDESILDDFSIRTPKYFYKRGFTDLDWEFWNLRSHNKNKSIVFPVYNEKKLLIGWTERFTKPFGSRYAQFLPKKSALYGIDKLKMEIWKGRKFILVVEGNFDTIRAHNLLNVLKIKCDVVGLVGLGMQVWQARFIKSNYTNVIIMLDNDEEGLKAFPYVNYKLKGIAKCRFNYGDEVGKDICEIDQDYFSFEIKDCIKRNSKRLRLV